MKTNLPLAVCIVLAAGFVAVHADDNPSQAAARAALVKKLMDLDQTQPQPRPRWDSGATVVNPEKPTNQFTGNIATKSATPPPAPAAKEPATVPALAIPATPPPAAATPIVASPTTPQPPTATPLIATPKIEVPVATTPVGGVRMIAIPPQQLHPLAATATSPAKTLVVGTKSSNPPNKVQRTNDLVTTTGAIYKNAQVERVETDGLIISYAPSGGGMAITKVYFEDLPAPLRQQYEKKKPIGSAEKQASPTSAPATK